MKISLMFHYDFDEIITLLTDEEAGKLLKSAYSYELRGEKTSFEDRMLQATYLRVIGCLERNKAKYEETVRKRKEAALKRWNKDEINVS